MSENKYPVALGALTNVVKKSVRPGAPKTIKSLVARGRVPMKPSDLVIAQYVLLFDADPSIARLAAAGLSNMHPRIANAVVGDASLPPPVLAYLGKALAKHDRFVQQLLLNPATPVDAWLDIAQTASEDACEVMVTNLAKIQQRPEIARALIENPNARRSSVERLAESLVRSGIVIEGLGVFEEARRRLDRARPAFR